MSGAGPIHRRPGGDPRAGADLAGDRASANADRGPTVDDGIYATCPSENEVVAFIEHRLDPGEVELLHRHLDTCADCRGLVADLMSDGVAGSTVREEEPAVTWSSDGESDRDEVGADLVGPDRSGTLRGAEAAAPPPPPAARSPP